MLKKVLITIILVVLGLQTQAQEDLEYKMEVGLGVGAVSYEGDFNGSILKNAQPMFSAVLKKVLNPRMAFSLAASYGKLKGSATDVQTYYPTQTPEHYSFDNALVDVSLTYEYNFWPYGTGKDYRHARRLTPFVFGGIGATYVNANKTVFTANVPLGVGVKYKLGERLNLGIEWGIHFTLSDKLDGVEDPYGIQSSGLFKNTDSYSMLALKLTYSFMPKCRTCNKDI